MALARSRVRVLATFVAGTLLVAGTAYGVGVAIVHSPASAGPELVATRRQAGDISDDVSHAGRACRDPDRHRIADRGLDELDRR